MANLVACRACGNQISSDAKACPRCGARPRHLGFLQILIGSVVVLAIIGAVVGKDRDPAPSSAPTQTVAEAPPRAAEADPIEVSPEQLRKDYAANEVSADERYRGKVLRVSGIIKAIKKDFLDEPYIVLPTDGTFENVDAHFSKAAGGALSRLSAGQHVTVQCVGNNVVIGSPQLKDCSLR